MNADASVFPADELEGVTLTSGWKIEKRIARRVTDTGGCFSTCYTATRNGNNAFVKAIDFRRAFHEKDFIAALHTLTGHVLWEKELSEFCAAHGMSRIVRLLDYEDFANGEGDTDPARKVCCLVFEIGKGDLRRHFDIQEAPKISWRFRVLRDIALGLDQLHRRG